jgi:hypothetical protein
MAARRRETRTSVRLQAGPALALALGPRLLFFEATFPQ